MREILQKLLESDLLSDETKQELTEQFEAAVEAHLAEEREKLELEIRSTLTEEFVQAREELASTVESKVEDFLNAEFNELTEDISKFRDLEVEYAEKLVEEKEALAQTLSEQLNQLTGQLDAFLEVRLDEELAELKEDIEDTKKLEFGRKIFEAVEDEFKRFRRTDLSNIEQELAEAKDKLSDATKLIADMQTSRMAEARSAKLEQVLENLSGNAREQMKIILSNVSTDKLTEAYNLYIGRILKESTDKKQKKEKPLTEATDDSNQDALITGNDDDDEDVQLQEAAKPSDQLARFRQLAGLTNR